MFYTMAKDKAAEFFLIWSVFSAISYFFKKSILKIHKFFHIKRSFSTVQNIIDIPMSTPHAHDYLKTFQIFAKLKGSSSFKDENKVFLRLGIFPNKLELKYGIWFY